METPYKAINSLVLVGVGRAALLLSRRPGYGPPPNDAWFRSAVLQQSQPVLVKFGRLRCGPCRMLDGELSQLADSGPARVVKIDVGLGTEARGTMACRQSRGCCFLRQGRRRSDGLRHGPGLAVVDRQFRSVARDQCSSAISLPNAAGLSGVPGGSSRSSLPAALCSGSC